MKKVKLNRFFLTVIVSAIGAFIAIYGYTALRNHLTANYWTTDYFSITEFRQIKPSMSCDEVRKLIGIPIVRKRFTRAGWYWIYSQPLYPDKPYKKFLVVFDNDTNKVTRSSETIVRASKDPKTGLWVDTVSPFAKPWKITHFEFSMVQGELPKVTTEIEEMYLLQLMATWCKPCENGRIIIEKLLIGTLSDIPIQLLLVSMDKSKETLREYLRKNEILTQVAWDPNENISKRMNQNLIPKYLILKGNTIYPFDVPHYIGQSDEFYDDLVWFIRYHANVVSR